MFDNWKSVYLQVVKELDACKSGQDKFREWWMGTLRSELADAIRENEQVRIEFGKEIATLTQQRDDLRKALEHADQVNALNKGVVALLAEKALQQHVTTVPGVVEEVDPGVSGSPA